MRSITVRSAILLALAFILLSAPLANAYEWVTLKPTGGKKQTLTINGKKRTYYRLAPGESMQYNVSKYDKVRIITRADLKKSKLKETIYSFRLGYDAGNTQLYARATTADAKVLIGKKKGVVGEDRILMVNNPEGGQTLKLKIGKTAKEPVYFRVQRERIEPIRKAKYVAYNPRKYDKLINLTVRENITPYYLIDKDQKLKVEVNGPTTFKALVRVMMTDDMRGDIKFPIAVYEDGKLKNTYRISTTASEVAVLHDHPEYRPSRGDDMYIEVPKGKHTYSFALPENGKEVILRFFVPEKDLNKEADK